MVIKIIASLLTGIGGHFLNGRWDKALLFFCLFIISLVSTSLIDFFYFNFMASSPEESLSKIQAIVKWQYGLLVFGIAAVWILSLITLIMDSNRNIESNLVKWTKSGIAGAIITSLISFLIIVSTITATLSFFGENSESCNISGGTSESVSGKYPSRYLYEYRHFGGAPPNSRSLPAPPKGEGVLHGKLTYKKKPAKKVRLDIVLNSKYQAKGLITDADGEFTLKLPPGTWRINSICAESWENAPIDESLTLYSDVESKLTGNKYNQYSSHYRRGYPIEVDQNPDKIHINLTFSTDIRLKWPNPDEEALPASISDVISWEPYPEASKYYVEIKRIRREGSTTHYSPITSILLHSDTSIPLYTFKHLTPKNKENTEYGVEVYAFSEDGTLLSEFSDVFHGGTFLLSDGNILVEDSVNELLDDSPDQDSDAIQKKWETVRLERKKGQAAAILIQEKMFDEARELLNRMRPDLSQGAKEMLTGYLYAAEGNCTEAILMFEKAMEVNPDVCIPNQYRADCM